MAITGQGTTFKYGGTAIADVISISGPGVTVATIDTTTIASIHRTFLAGSIDSGEMTLEIHYDPNTPSPLEDAIDNSASTAPPVVECIITFSDGSDWTFDGFITAFSPGVSIDGAATASISIKATSSVTIST
jgi:hypothetical protein